MVALRGGVDGVAEVAKQMPPVRHLHGIWRTLPGTIRIGAGPVAGHDLDAGVPLEPSRQGLGLAVRQQVEHAVPLEVDEHGPVAMAASPGPIIDPEHAHGRPRLRRRVVPACHPQQRVGAGGHGQPRREPGAGLAAQRQAEVTLQVAEARGPAAAAGAVSARRSAKV